MGYDRGDSFLFDFEPNGFPFGPNGIVFEALYDTHKKCAELLVFVYDL